MIQLNDHMNLKKKDDESVDASVLLRRRNKINIGARQMEEIKWRSVIVGDEELGGSYYKVLCTWKAKASQDLTGMTLAEILNKVEIEPVENHIQSLGTSPGWGMGPPTYLKNINPELLLFKGNAGT